ncbi:MAG: ribose-5-phosphate isomerase RpiA [Candidatus Nezhaarchaeota archaeon]|nr:ribose-5-phosphate isomerase RpiA [Candidatus Nezhaarchaeota archaeon]MCX8142133.1 ribose-5-phosphate isomerase RpiA [Candidatus Nezhaarchaeota archaeon]MDW8050086.1 ribose-5-phosphate isomerase RpiA [Nitrososphaerota archaeon]
MSIESCKIQAAKAALREVRDGMILGLGTGSTVECFASLLRSEVKRGLKVKVVPTSYHSIQMAIKYGFELVPVELVDYIDVIIDGADEVDRQLNMIKGRGAALAREKVVACMSSRRVYIVSYDKVVDKLCSTKPIPIEVLPFAYRYVMRRIREIDGKPELRGAGRFKDGPLVTDNGNFIVDAYFNPIDDPCSMEARIKSITGVIEVGLFCNIADVIYVGKPDGIEVLERAK